MNTLHTCQVFTFVKPYSRVTQTSKPHLLGVGILQFHLNQRAIIRGVTILVVHSLVQPLYYYNYLFIKKNFLAMVFIRFSFIQFFNPHFWFIQSGQFRSGQIGLRLVDTSIYTSFMMSLHIKGALCSFCVFAILMR